VLRRLPVPKHPDLLVGTASGDDAAVWRVDEHRALVATVDVFTPVVDDARTWGAIAAANSASDVYAMGGRPLFALNIAGWPRDKLSLDLLAEVLEGASEVADRGKWLVVGGHTIDSLEPFFGQSVTGEVDPAQIIGNNHAKVGDVIILTKALGTGLLTTAAKRLEPSDIEPGGAYASAYDAAIASMLQLNDTAADVARRHGVKAGTDITGFGLLGHLGRVASSSNVTLRINTGALPVLPGTFDLIDEGFIPGGTTRNMADILGTISGEKSNDPRWMALLCDPQTSGGLALCIPSDRADDVLEELTSLGLPASVIAEIETRSEAVSIILE
jgi:selenide, water dikinase